MEEEEHRRMEVEELIFLHVCCIRGDGGKPAPKGVARYLNLALIFLLLLQYLRCHPSPASCVWSLLSTTATEGSCASACLVCI